MSEESTLQSARMTIEDQLAAMRQGREFPASFMLGAVKIRCRILSGNEMVRIEQTVLKREQEEVKDVQLRTESWQFHEVRKELLMLATSGIEGTGGIPDLTPLLLEAMSFEEVLFAYNCYLNILMQVNPTFAWMKPDDLETMIEQVKKNPWQLKECTSTQLAAIVCHLLDIDMDRLLTDRYSG